MNLIRTLTRSTSIHVGYRSFVCDSPVLNKQSDADLKISQACVDRLKKIASNGVFLRVIVDGGGCSGFQYRFDLDTDLHDDDECFEKNGAKIVVDKMSLPFLKGSTVDFHEELIRSAFRITDNPQADSGCSCGASFAVKM